MSIRDIYIARALSGGSAPVAAEPKDVNFYDYDGTILYSYTAEEFAALDALPANPAHDGLTSQGWNWSLADAKAQVTAMGKCNIGQMYVTTDGKTHIDINLTAGRTSPYLCVAVNGSIDVDWGDNTEHSTVTGSKLSTQVKTLHAYSAAGEYTIKIGVNSGSYSFYGTSSSPVLNANKTSSNANKVYANAVRNVRIGGDAVNIGAQAFNGCSSLLSVTIPVSITSIGDSAFSNCYSLSHVTLPRDVTSIDSVVATSNAISSISIPSGMTSIGASSFTSCVALQSIAIPSGLTSIGSSAFSSSLSLSSITIPSNVSSIGATAFSSCYGLAEMHFKPSSPPAVANSNAFTNLQTDCIIYVPTGKLNDYKTASNYPDPNTYTYVEE